MPRSKTNILNTKSTQFQQKVVEAPLLPGCYMYKNADGDYIYIGKAKILRNRVRSYFNNYSRIEPRIQQMIDEAVDIEMVVVDSEPEALILEANLVKKYDPQYNILLKDDKSYVYVKFDKVNASKNDEDWKQIPSVSVVREEKGSDGYYFGPYPNVTVVKRLLKRLRRIFPYCTSKKLVLIPKDRNAPLIPKDEKPCFQYHIELCDGVCAGKITRGQYEKQLNSIKSFFSSQKNVLIGQLETKMQRAAKKQDYERAAQYRDRIQELRYVGRNMLVDTDTDEVAIQKAKKERQNQALNDLIEQLRFPAEKLKKHKGFRIECYDISNIQGTNAVGSMIVFVDGEPKPQLYRRFRIKYTEGPNDFGMLQEVLTRRFNQYLRAQLHRQKSPSVNSSVEEYTLSSEKGQNSASGNTETIESTDIEGFTIQIPKDLERRMKNWKPDESFSQLPDLMIIDGGKGQLSSTYRILRDFGLAESVPIVGLAKREEEIFKVTSQFEPDNPEVEFEEKRHRKVTYLPEIDSDGFSLVRLPKRSESLYLVQRIRDEAHRFAITYHRKLRSKQLTNDIKRKVHRN